MPWSTWTTAAGTALAAGTIVYFIALAADYDGTLAHGGVLDSATRSALVRFKESGRRLIMVTGRQLPELRSVCRDLDIFDLVVAENGALIYDPATKEERALAPPPPPLFIQRLQQKKVQPLSVGRSIVATWEPEENAVLEVIRDLGLELQIIFNKGAVMVLPSGVNKASGLAAALDQLELSPHNVVGVGDAENDHAFMRACGCAAAVGNALPMVKQAADVVLRGERGAGVAELIEIICQDDHLLAPPARHGIPIGAAKGGTQCLLEPNRGSVLIAGSSGIGKSTLATALTERMAERDFAFCVFDPEGDYDELEHAVAIGDSETPPQIDEAVKLLEQAHTNVVINTQCFALAERPAFFARIMPQIAALRARTGRPHWLLIDEAHHLLPVRRDDFAAVLPDTLPNVILITVHPEAVSRDVLKTVQTVIALGEGAVGVVEAVFAASGAAVPQPLPTPEGEQVLLVRVGGEEPPGVIEPEHPQQARRRHTRKYAEGRLGEDRSFYFRGPHDLLNLRAHNLVLFLEIAAGVDDATWEHHRRAGDYSRWFREAIKDEDLAREAAEIEANTGLDARRSRDAIEQIVKQRYSAPVR